MQVGSLKALSGSLIVLLLLPGLVSGHEEQNIQYPSDDYLWTFSKEIGHNEVFEWDFFAEAVGYEDREGIIRIEALEHLYAINLLEFLDTNSSDISDNDTLDNYEKRVNQLFDINFDDNIAYFSDVYPVDYFIVPIMFKSQNTELVNLFETQFNRNQFYISLVNDTIDNSCIQGCHKEDVTPFETISSSHKYDDNQLIIDGQFRVRDFPGSVAYNYDQGIFEAKYDIEKGVLVSWYWESDDGTDSLEITLRRFTQQEVVMIVIIGSMFLIVIGIAIWVFKRPRFSSAT